MIALTCTERNDRAYGAPEGKAWDLNITCSVKQTDSITVRQKEKDWDGLVFHEGSRVW